MKVTGMFAALAALLLLSAAQAEMSRAGGRHLTQAKLADASQCLWMDRESVCIPNMQNMLAVSKTLTPGNVFRRAYLMALDRADACTKHTAAAACNGDKAHRCFWRPVDNSKSVCYGADFAEVFEFERSGYAVGLATVPSSMTCPGTKAADLLACYSFPAPELCSKLPGCTPATVGSSSRPACLSKYAAGLDKKAAETFATQVKNLDPAVFGSCEAACWLKQAKACSSSGNQAACEKNPMCQYSAEAKACARITVAKPGTDAYDDQVGSLMNACSKLKTKSACQAKSVVLSQSGQWVAWKANATAANC